MPPAGTPGEEGPSGLCCPGSISIHLTGWPEGSWLSLLFSLAALFGVDENARKIAPKSEGVQYRIFICNYCTLVTDFENKNKVYVNYKL